ncbi:MAG: GIY-YIG nuclease family protein [Verrucomicrobiota bacterium]
MPPPSLRYGAASRNPGLQDSIPLGLAKPITTLQTSLFIPLESSRNQIYTGITCDLKLRLAEHNSGRVSHTSKFTPKVRCSSSGGARAPSRAAVGAPADRFFALLSKLYRSSLGGKAALSESSGSNHRHVPAQPPPRLGGTSQDSRDARTVRTAGAWAQFQAVCAGVFQ